MQMAHKKKTTRSSLIYCQENFSCRTEKSEAVIVCVECETSQCDSCDTSIHGNERHRYHERKVIDKPKEEELCQQGRCSEKSYCDVWCEDCNNGFCYTCDAVKHKQKRKLHERILFKVYQENRLKFRQADISDRFSNVTFEGTIKDSDLPISNSPNLSEFVSCTSEESAAMVPLEEAGHFTGSKTSLPDIVDNHTLDGFQSVNDSNKDVQSFLLVDTKEYLQVASSSDFIKKLGCDEDCLVKVISIFGNTGDGKSHTLNHTFFGGREVFKTSNSQDTCTIGVWAAFDHVHKIVVLDTEGLLGTSSNANQRTRLLLKVLAVSDIVIYRTRAERLHDDLFHFLGDASMAYTKHFSKELRTCLKKCHLKNISSLGPSVIIFHETFYTDPLDKGIKAFRGSQHAQDKLKQTFGELEIDIAAFSAVDYVGLQTEKPPTDFHSLLLAVKSKLDNNNVRSHRRPDIVFSALQALNEKFSGEIEHFTPTSFPDQYFTCTAKCLSCGLRCENTMNHEQDRVVHEVSKKCRYQHQYENKIYMCKKCLHNGEKVEVVPKAFSSKDSSWLGMAAYAWSGYVLECPYCGVIYRSRQYWYGNDDPDRNSVQTEICHVWPGGSSVVQGTHNAARKLVDGLTYVSETIASVSSKPAKVVGNWVTDQIAPAYWVPNALIKKCHQCSRTFNEQVPIHHCRACGEGFCQDCSSQKKAVPERGWGGEPVRVCDNCYHGSTSLTDSSNSEGTGEDHQVNLRKGVEVVGSTVATLMSYPLDALKESSRPVYWVPDTDIEQCCVCKERFGPTLYIHHCRDCGQGVCSGCSPHQKPVPSRGWDTPVRVCNTCVRKSRTA